MRLVIDANILFAALLKDATTRELLLEDDMEFFAPEYLLSEVNSILKYPRVRKRIPLNEKDLSELKSAILSRIIFIPEEAFIPFIKRSIGLVTHIEYAPYIALSLTLKIPLWSNDSALKEQRKVIIYTTSELIELLRI